MKRALIAFSASALTAAALLGAASSSVLAQRAPAQSAPAKPTPLASDGHPNLTGIWGGTGELPPPKAGQNVQVLLPVRGVNPNSADVFKGLDRQAVAQRAAAPNKPVYKPELLAKVKELSDKQDILDPAFYCKPQGVPRMGAPSQIIQLPSQMVFLYANNWFRVIPTDGRPHRTDIDSAYLGDPVGRWDGDTFVVDVTGFNDDTWLGSDGYFHSDALHVVEKFQRAGDVLTYNVTVEDPNVLAQPWVLNPRTMKLSINSSDLLFESPPCVEHDAPHLVTFEHH